MTELPAGWAWAELAEVCTSITDGDHQAPPQVSVGIPFLVIGNIRDHQLDFTDCRHVPTAYFESLNSTRRPQKGDVLYSLVGSYGIPVLVREDTSFCVQRHIGILRPSPEISSAFLALVMASRGVFNQATRYATGTAQLTVPLSGLRRIRIPVPPRTEQQRIVAAIDEAFLRIDAGVAGLQRVRRHLGFLRNAVLKALSNHADQWVKLGEIAEVVGGVTKDAKRQTNPSYVEVPYLRVANVQRGYLDLRTVTTIRVPASTARKLRLEPDDILFNEGGDRDKLGRGWVWEGQVPNCIHQNHVFRARLRTDEFDPKFVSMHGNTFGRTWFETMGKQTTNLASVSRTTLTAFPVPKIPIDEQRRLVAQVEAQTAQIDAFETIVEVATRRAAALRSTIISSAFSGRLVPQDPNDEPVSVLLDRIASKRGSSNSSDNTIGARKAHNIHQKVIV